MRCRDKQREKSRLKARLQPILKYCVARRVSRCAPTRGFTLIEMVVAIALATTMVAAVYTTTISMSNAAQRQQETARQEARQTRAIEIIRRDLRGWLATTQTPPCLAPAPSSISPAQARISAAQNATPRTSRNPNARQASSVPRARSETSTSRTRRDASDSRARHSSRNSRTNASAATFPSPTYTDPELLLCFTSSADGLANGVQDGGNARPSRTTYDLLYIARPTASGFELTRLEPQAHVADLGQGQAQGRASANLEMETDETGVIATNLEWRLFQTKERPRIEFYDGKEWLDSWSKRERPEALRFNLDARTLTLKL